MPSPMGVAARRAAGTLKRRLCSGSKPFQHRVGLGDGLRLGQTQFLHPAILGRAEGTFHAALGLRAVGLDQVDVQLGQGPAELRFALVIGLAFFVRLEDAVAIRVQAPAAGHTSSASGPARSKCAWPLSAG